MRRTIRDESRAAERRIARILAEAEMPGAERAGVRGAGAERTGAREPSAERAGAERAGAERAGAERAGAERAWAIVGEAFAARGLGRAPLGRRLRLGPSAVAVAACAAVVAVVVALTPPGDAVAQFFTRIVTPAPTKTVVVSAPSAALPAPGRLLVVGGGEAWLAGKGGPTRLGRFDGATWSPRGFYVAGWRGDRLTAVGLAGDVRWEVTAPAPVTGARWAPDGFLVAYRAGGDLWLVAGDGSGAHQLAPAAPVAPAWRPGAPHVLAWLTPTGVVRVIDAATGAPVWRSAGRFRDARSLSWSADGTRLAILSRTKLRIAGVPGKRVVVRRAPAGRRFLDGAFAPRGARYAVLEAAGPRTRLVQLDAALRRDPAAFLIDGRFTSLAWAPNAKWLAVGWPKADEWVLAPGDGAAAIRAIVDTTKLLGADEFADVAGWCCARSR